MKQILFILSLILIFGCKSTISKPENVKINYIKIAKAYYDDSRDRLIPVEIFVPKNMKTSGLTPVIFNHGYGANKGDDYSVNYTYLLETLGEKKFFVISIQHELKTDELLSMDEPFKITRMENWQRGAQNIGFVLQSLKTEFPDANYSKLAIIGHSNGGDMAALFTQENPQLVNKLITMDNRRMDLPRTSKPKIYTLRSSDYPADEGVLPTLEEQKKFGIVVQPTNIKHSSMDNDANSEERKYLTTKILEYLNEK